MKENMRINEEKMVIKWSYCVGTNPAVVLSYKLCYMVRA